jgi:hypothetical protein
MNKYNKRNLLNSSINPAVMKALKKESPIAESFKNSPKGEMKTPKITAKTTDNTPAKKALNSVDKGSLTVSFM